MKWALIYLLGTSGIWDSGYRFGNYDSCSEKGVEVVNSWTRSNVTEGLEYETLALFKCLPSKE